RRGGEAAYPPWLRPTPAARPQPFLRPKRVSFCSSEGPPEFEPCGSESTDAERVQTPRGGQTAKGRIARRAAPCPGLPCFAVGERPDLQSSGTDCDACYVSGGRDGRTLAGYTGPRGASG